MRILAPFCSFYAFHRPCSYSLVSLVRSLALSVFLMDCIDLSLTRSSHCWTSQLHFALFMRSTDLDLTHVISADLALYVCSFYLFHRPCSHSFLSLLCIQPPFRPFCAFFGPCSHSQPLFLQIGTLFFRFYTLHRRSSHSQQSLLQIRALFCCFYA